MKHYKLKATLASIAFLCTAGAGAQNLNSSYFMEGMTYRHQLNPAFMNESNYINMPLFMLGNFNMGLKGNIGVNDFLYKYNQNGYKLTTFMNPMVNGQEFLGNLHNKNLLNVGLSMPIIAFGFHSWGGFNTFGLNLRSNTSVNLPYGLFNFMKTGMDNAAGNHYSVEDLTVRTNNYVEVAFGHAREILEDRLTAGAKVKFLIGGGNANAYIKKMDITMGQDEWIIDAQGTAEGSVKGGYFTSKDPEEQGKPGEIDGFKVDGAGVAGYGLAFDLGAVYKMDDYLEGLTISASLLDLGFIRWNNALNAEMKHSYTFKGFENPIAVKPDEGAPGDIDDELDNLGDQFKEFIKFYDKGNTSGRTTALAATMNIGAEYTLPYYKKLRFGFLSSTHFNKPFTWSEGRISANVAPVDWFDASVNYAISSFGSSLGWVLNFHPNGFNFFIGTDHMITKVTPQFVPVGNANANVCIGFNITWGKKKCKKVVTTTTTTTSTVTQF